MKKRNKRPRPLKQLIVISFFAVVCLGLLASSIGRSEFSGPHKLILEVLGTAQSGFSGLSSFGGSFFSDYVALWGVRDENARLREEIKKYQVANIKYREAQAVNLQLEMLLDLKKNLPPPTLAAVIQGRDPSLWYKTVTINRGTADGVAKGMPVVTVEGIVGQVLDTGSHYAKVLLACDPNSAVEVLLQESRVQGILKGSGTGYRMHYVLKNNEVKVGDQVVTSGQSDVFPSGLPVGVVSKVTNNDRGMFLDIEIEPAVKFSQLEHVIIVMKSNQLAD